MPQTQLPVEVFLSYAQADESLCLELEKHLSVLKREGLMSTWHKRQLIAGSDWSQELDHHLSTASVIVLLLSANFVHSDYCYGVEMQRAMQRHEAGEAHVIPLLLRPMGQWQSAPFGKLVALPSNQIPLTQWRNRDAAFADVVEGIRERLENVQGEVVSTPATTLPGIWNIPYPRNPFFTGQEDVHTQLATALEAGQVAALSQPQAVTGLGGIGKTQIALEFAYQHREDYEAVFWVLAETRESLVSGYMALAQLLNLPQMDEQDQAVIVQAVKSWLQTHSSWLLILDNADELAIVREFVPPSFGGRILLTTRAQSMGRFAKGIEVETMSQDVGALFLLRRAGRVSEDAQLDAASFSDRSVAREISFELGGLPLALDQAGAYIEEVRCGLDSYLASYRKRRAVLLARRGGLVDDHPHPVASTWSLAFEKVEQWSALAADLLRVCAFLAPDAIPEEIIAQGADHLGPSLALLAEGDGVLDEVIAPLLAYSLVRRNRETKTLSMHRLVQAVLKDAMDEQTKWRWAERVVQAVSVVFPEEDFTVWSQCERYLPHALVCADLIEQGRRDIPEAGSVLHKAGAYLIERARYLEAGPLLQQALQIREGTLGEAHLETAETLDRLARLFEVQGKYEQAERLHERALAIREEQLGESHPDTASSLNNWAGLYCTQGKYHLAEPLYQRALSIAKEQLGPTHPSTALSLNNLAGLYCIQGKYSEALPLLERALSIKEQELGELHPSTARSVWWLAVVSERQEQHEKAEQWYRRALSVYKQTLGETHASTEKLQQQYASLLKKMGRSEPE